MALGRRMRQFREAKGWSQEKFAERAGIDRSYVAAIETGLRNPSAKALGKIAKGFGVTLSAFLEGVG
jgi:transcriptional regulator with XRE-family HTH domain